MEHAPEKRFPVDAKEYKLYEEVGEGVSATVFRALCIPLNEIVAVKVLDLEKCNNDLDGIRREVQTMSLISHPNLLQAHCSFTTGHSLWVVMPYMAGGSCLHIMKSAYPEGFEEAVIATLLHEVLKALVYLHAHGHIHRDVKAGNILVDNNGAVKLADFGVSACMFDTGDRQRSRNTFVGTPCWMAPEVMQQLHGYDFKADIWSFGITALELAHGHAPFSKYPPMKVLLMTLQNAPPGLDYERDKRFSKSFKELVAACLVKDPKKRPPSEKLLKHHFFKRARAPGYLSRTILDGLAPLGDRFRTLKAKEAALLVQNKNLYEDKEQLSQQEYMRGISAWNFNLDDLKSQAAMIQDFDTMQNADNSDLSEKQKDHHDEAAFPVETSSSEIVEQSNSTHPVQEEFTDLRDLERSLASFPIKPLQALKDCFDVIEDDAKGSSPGSKGTRSDSEDQLLAESPPRFMEPEIARKDGNHVQNASLSHRGSIEHRKFLGGPLQMDSSKRITVEGDRDYQQVKYPHERNYSGQLFYRHKKDINNFSSVEDKSEGGIVQRKGRFKVTSAELSPKVTSAELSPKGPVNSSFGTVLGSSSNSSVPNPTVAMLLPTLQCVLQQNTMQREEVIRMINFVEQISGKNAEPIESSINELMQTSPVSTKERELRSLVAHLQQSIDSLVEELERQKTKNAEVEKQLNFQGNAVRKGE